MKKLEIKSFRTEAGKKVIDLVIYPKVIATMVALFDDNKAQANAEMICRAVNCHDELVEVLYKLINAAEQTTKDLVGFDGAPALDNAIDNARAALSKAETK